MLFIKKYFITAISQQNMIISQEIQVNRIESIKDHTL